MRYNFKKILFLNFFVLGFFACPVSICGVFGMEEARAATYYVRADGAVVYANRANATSPDSADTALNLAQVDGQTWSPGDKIKFSDQGGDYDYYDLDINSSGNADTDEGRIFFEAVDGENPNFTPTSGNSIIEINGADYVTIDGLIFTPALGVIMRGIRFRTDTNNYIVIKNCTFSFSNSTNTSSFGIVHDNVSVTNLVLDNNVFIDLLNADILISNAGNSNVIISNTTSTPGGANNYWNLSNINGLTLNNNSITAGTPNISRSIYINNCSGILDVDGLSLTGVYRVEILNSSFDTGSSINGFSATNGLVSDMFIDNSSNIDITNYTSAGGTSGIYLDNTSHDISVSSSITEGVDIRLYGASHDVDIYDNSMTESSDNMIGIHEGSYDVNILRNRFYVNGTFPTNNGGMVIHDDSYNIQIAYNIFEGNVAYGIHGTNTTHGWIYNNTFYRNGTLIGNTADESGLSIDVTDNNSITGTSWVANNNTFYENGEAGGNYELSLTAVSRNLVIYDYNNYKPINNDTFATLDGGSNPISWVAYNSSYETNSQNANPLFNNAPSNDFTLNYLSPVIDAGTDVGLTTDFDGNPIYGTPDIGAYEYQPPHTIGNNRINIQAGARIYGDGKFRDLAETSNLGADLTITPQNNFLTYEADEPRPEFLDITDITWTAIKKEWTETASNISNTIHTVGDSTPNVYYYIKVDNELKNITGEDCEDNICKADANGKINFTYTGNYSTHTFQVTPREGEIVTELTDADLKINNNKETLDKDTKLYLDKDKAKLKGENPEIANGKVKIYKDNEPYKEVIVDENGKWSKTIKFGHNYNYKIKLKFFDEFNTFRDEKEYEVKVDTEDPNFKDKEYNNKEKENQFILTTKDDKIVFTAEDEETDIDYYKIKVLDKNGQIIRKWKKQKEDFYEIPKKIKDEAKTVIVRAYDRAGNKSELRFEVDPRKALPRGEAPAKSLTTGGAGEVQEVINVETEVMDEQEELQESSAEPATGNNSSETKTEIQPTASETPATNPPADESKWWNPFSWF